MAPFRPSQRVHRALHSSLLFFTAMARSAAQRKVSQVARAPPQPARPIS